VQRIQLPVADGGDDVAGLEARPGKDGGHHFPAERLHQCAGGFRRPGAWKKQPYYGQLHQWARNNPQKGIYVIVFVNEMATLIMPDQEVPLGPMQPTDGIAVCRSGNAYEARLIPGGAAAPPVPPPG
jgi:hypothetical protein